MQRMDLYFNEIDSFTAAWCRNAFPGAKIDERSILDITQPVDAVRQHYFAGLGGWEYACRLAGWPADWPLWTGSCPCQPFSLVGRRQAQEDERDLWPAFFRLISIGRPPIAIGEQVNSAITFGWLDRVCDDLEGIGYAVGAAVLPACGVDAPHIRQRLYWCAVRVGDPDRSRLEGLARNGGFGSQPGRIAANEEGHHWAASHAIYCRDGRWRRIPLESEFQPLADRGRWGDPRSDSQLSSRTGALKAAGNAIVIPLAAKFIGAVMDSMPGN